MMSCLISTTIAAHPSLPHIQLYKGLGCTHHATMPPPKRVSDVLASSADTRIPSAPNSTTDAPYSSEGPTLPIIGAAQFAHGGQSTNIPAPQQGQKRKRTAPDNDKTQSGGGMSNKSDMQKPVRTNHSKLYEPWVLLPGKARREVEKRGTENVMPIVYSKNQNVRSGITKLRRYLGLGNDQASDDVPTALRQEAAIIAVSAQGDGTVKLVGIVDMVRRITGEKEAEKGCEVEKEKIEGIKWYMYTALSSVVVPRGKEAANGVDAEGQEKGQAGSESDAMDVDGDDVAVEEMQGHGHLAEERRNAEGKTKTVPVLTVWMTRKRIPSFRDAFGEEDFVVHMTES